ncbi:MAG: OmpH family outer membrane protein [Cyclobacteriaceae bacterium]|nr:OmpH family outer membrane protein [Cyclobacteriaceae bacterium]
MKKLIIAVMVLLMSGLINTYAQSNLKIGYTNPDYILSLLPEAKQIEADLTAYSKQLETQLQSKMEEFQTKLSDYQQKVTSGQMIPEIQRDKEAELNGLRESIEKFQRDADASLQKKQVQLLQPAYDKIQNAINDVADENGYTHVFSSDAGAFAILLFAQEETNITNLVLRKLGIEPPAEEANN